MSASAEKKKRPANSPLAGSGKEFKESDVNSSPLLKGYVQACSLNSLGDVNILNLQSTSASTYASVTSNGVMATASNVLEVTENLASETSDGSYFRTQKPHGAFRDEIVVEVNTLNGEDYRGTVMTKEAIKTIFMGEMKISS